MRDARVVRPRPVAGRPGPNDRSRGRARSSRSVAVAGTRPRPHRRRPSPVHRADQRDGIDSSESVSQRSPTSGASSSDFSVLLVSPHPRTVARCTALCKTPRRSDDSVRVGFVLLRSLEQRVEVVEGSRAVHEVGDVSRLLGVDARRDVDQTNALNEVERSCATINAVRPPSDIPTSGRGGVMSCSSARSTSRA